MKGLRRRNGRGALLEVAETRGNSLAEGRWRVRQVVSTKGRISTVWSVRLRREQPLKKSVQWLGALEGEGLVVSAARPLGGRQLARYRFRGLGARPRNTRWRRRTGSGRVPAGAEGKRAERGFRGYRSLVAAPLVGVLRRRRRAYGLRAGVQPEVSPRGRGVQAAQGRSPLGVCVGGRGPGSGRQVLLGVGLPRVAYVRRAQGLRAEQGRLRERAQLQQQGYQGQGRQARPQAPGYRGQPRRPQGGGAGVGVGGARPQGVRPGGR